MPFKRQRFRLLGLFVITLLCGAVNAATDNGVDTGALALAELKNYQENTATMLSSGLPEPLHFKAFKAMGVTSVIDLIPGDRSGEQQLVDDLGMAYTNIQVDWENPTLANFQQYVSAMQVAQQSGGKTLTHCKLNWRGSAFTYLYRVTQLNESDENARQDLDAIWQPNDTWQAFIGDVKHHYGME